MTFIAVNYNSTADSLKFAQHFDRAQDRLTGRAHLLLIDNTDGELSGQLAVDLRRAGSCALCLNPGGNLGYLGGARFGLEVLQSQGGMPQWVVVSNVDLTFDPLAFVEILEKIDATSVGVLAPSISSSLTGRDLNPYMKSRPSALRMHAYKWVYRYYLTMCAYEWMSTVRVRLRARNRAVSTFKGRESVCLGGAVHCEPIYAGHGSIMAFSSEFFRRGGNLDHMPFLFGEEISVAEAARRIGLPIVWVPLIKVEHHEHVSVGKIPGDLKYGFLREATAHCADRYF